MKHETRVLEDEKDFLSRLTNIYQVTCYPDETEVEIEKSEEMLENGGELFR